MRKNGCEIETYMGLGHGNLVAQTNNEFVYAFEIQPFKFTWVQGKKRNQQTASSTITEGIRQNTIKRNYKTMTHVTRIYFFILPSTAATTNFRHCVCVCVNMEFIFIHFYTYSISEGPSSSYYFSYGLIVHSAFSFYSNIQNQESKR